MWLYTKEMQEVGRIIISEHEGYWVQINAQPATCDNDIKFTSTNLTNTEVDFRYITIRVTDNGTFPGDLICIKYFHIKLFVLTGIQI